MSNANTHSGFWEDFKSLGKAALNILAVISFLLIVFFSMKAMYYIVRRALTGKPLPPREEFPTTWYVLGFMFLFFIIYIGLRLMEKYA